MTDVFDFREGSSPLLVSIPHDGRTLLPGQAERMTDAGLALPDTDWHVRELYSFVAETGASVIAANYSRYVVDLNRPASDESLYENQLATGLYPRKTSDGQDIYLDGESVSSKEQETRFQAYWQPYHDRIFETLNQLKDQFGYALLWDAHSIAGEVPLLFDGVLPDLNIGTNGGASCATEITAAVAAAAQASPYSSVTDGRFRGGHITRSYGAPEDGVHAMQLELTQQNYMDQKNLSYDAKRAVGLVDTIKSMLHAFETSATRGT
ncbi:MAG: N-formylglutamate deformylase [Gammaproteobacteria bacterium]|nr:MAG: N-formylglutamate deformylase [Gammaproteobacteria bacterium]